jgi:hypothetical protein
MFIPSAPIRNFDLHGWARVWVGCRDGRTNEAQNEDISHIDQTPLAVRGEPV